MAQHGVRSGPNTNKNTKLITTVKKIVIVVPGLDDVRILPVMNGGPDMARTSDGELERVDVEALLVGVGLGSRFKKLILFLDHAPGK